MAKKKSTKTTPTVEDELVEEMLDSAAEEQQPREESVEDPLQAALTEAADNKDLYLRALADLENYRKRAQREKEDAIRFANDNILRNIIPVLDNLERAIEHARLSDDQGSLLEGVEMTLDQFHKVLETSGVTQVEALGQPFDPNYHQAMGQIPSSDHPPNTVVQELQKGYMLNNRLLRPSMVMVAMALPEATENETTTDIQDDDLPDTDE